MYVVPFFFHEIKIWRLFRQTVRRIEVVNIFHFSILNSCTLTYLRDVLSPFHENSFENAVNFISYLLAYRHVFVFLRKLLPRSYFPLIIWRMFSRNGKCRIFQQCIRLLRPIDLHEIQFCGSKFTNTYTKWVPPHLLKKLSIIIGLSSTNFWQ